MDSNNNNNNNRGSNNQDSLQHGSVETNTRDYRDYANHEKAVTQPTPSSDKNKE